MYLSLTRQFVIILAVTSFLSALVASLPAFLLIRTTLNQGLELCPVLADAAGTNTPVQFDQLLLNAERQLLIAVGLSTLLIAVMGSLASGLYLRQLVLPLWNLVKAARNMGRGDLNTPIRVAAKTLDIQTLAATLEQSRVQLAQKMKDDAQRRHLQAYFLANMSHEFRTPLAGLKVSIELLMENIQNLSTSETHDLLNSLHMSAISLQNLIDNLLESSKIEANQFTLRRRPARLNEFLAESFRIIRPLLHRRQQVLTLTMPLHIPQVNIDPVRLVQVVVNLLSNASKYSPSGTVIDFVVEMQQDQVMLSLADRGSGIDPDQQKLIFQRFVRLENAPNTLKPDDIHGTGLGLSVVKAIVEGHGGKVGVKAREGGGAVFWFTLPVHALP